MNRYRRRNLPDFMALNFRHELHDWSRILTFYSRYSVSDNYFPAQLNNDCRMGEKL